MIIPNPELSLREGAVSVWAKRNSMHFIEFLDALTRTYGTDIYTPFKDLPEGFQTAEFLLDHGFIDMIVPRKDLRSEIARLIDYCQK